MHRLSIFRFISMTLFMGASLYSFAQPLSAILPKNQSNLSNFNVTFSWNSAANVTNYKVEIATNTAFTSNYVESPLTNLTTWSSFVPFQGTYYWRIKGYVPNDSILSPTYSFSYFTPSNSASTTFWLKADAGVSLDASNKVQSWTDLSANGYSVIQSVAAKRPIVSNNSVNGYPSIQFAGAQVLSGGDILDLGFNSRSIFIVGKMAASNQSLLAKSKAANVTFRYGIIKDVTNTAFLFQSDNNTSNYSTFNTTNYALYNAFVNRTTAKNHFDVNNTSLGVSSFNSGLLFESNYRLLIGAYNNANDDGEVLFLNGNICEIIFSDTQDSTEILKIKNYLKCKYTSGFNLGADITISNGFCPQTITAPAGFSNYQWNTGATTASISVNQTGSYWVSAIDAFGFKWTDTLYVKFPTVSTPPSNVLCSNSNLTWNTGLGAGFSHAWSTGATGNTITISQPGTYSVQITGAGGCPSVAQTITFTLDTYPTTAFIGADTSLCIGNALGLQVGANSTVQYQWSDGSTNSTFTVTNPGTYNVSLNSTNSNGCQAQDTILISVAGTAPQVTLNLPQGVCTNAPVQISCNASVPAPGSVQSSLWTFANSVNLTGNSIQFNAPSAGILLGTLTVTAQDNCATTLPLSLNVNLPPNLGISHAGSCSNAPVTFQAMDSLGSTLVAFQWNFNQGAGTDTVASPSFVYHASGNVNAQLVAGNSNGCSDTLSYQFSLLSAPNAAFSISNVCEQSNLQLVNTSSSNDTSSLVAYSWNFGDGNNSTLATPYHAYAQEGTYLVALVSTAGNSCSDTLIQSVDILPKPDLTWVIGPSCRNNITVFQSQSTIPSGTLDSTSWLVNLQFPFHGTSGSYVFTTFGIQYLHLHTVSDLGCPRDTLILVDVQPGVSSAFNFEPMSVLAGDTVTLTSQSSGQSGQSWWVNQQIIGNQSSTQFVVGDSLEGQTLQASLIVENALGCTDTAHLAIQVNERTLEIEVKQVFYSEINGLHQVGAELVNLGTVPISRAQLYLSLTGQELLSSYVSDTILPGNSFYYVFPSAPNFSSLNQNETGDFYCVRADLAPFYSQQELDLTNNQQCSVLEDQSYELSPPSPNPASDQSNMTLVVNEPSTLSLEVVNTLGQQITQLLYNQLFEPGTYILSLDMSAWASGNYFIRCNNDESIKVYRILKNTE